MGTWPTSGTRGQSSQRNRDGSQGAGGYLSAAAAAFVAPAAGSAAAAEFGVSAPAVAAEVAIPGVEAAAQLASGAVARSALAGLSPVLLRLVPGLAIAYGLYLAAQALADYFGHGTGPRADGLGPGWSELTDARCSDKRDLGSVGGWSTCGEVLPVYPGDPYPGNGYNFWEALSWETDATGRRFAYARGASRWSFTGSGVWQAPILDGGPGVPFLRPLEVPGPDRLRQAVAGDSLARPGEELTQPPVLPYDLLPERADNPWRSPVEQAIRGNQLLPAGHVRNVLEPGREILDRYRAELDRVLREFSRPWPAPDARPPEWGWPTEAPPDTRPAPSERPTVAPGRPLDAPGHPEVQPEPATAPTRPVTPPGLPGETLPGWVASPGLPGKPATGAVTVEPPRISVELPPGAHGPTITIGGGPPVGPHLRQPPGPKEKERKSRYLRPGASLLIRKGVNPVTEVNDALNCVYKALPKGLRWKIEKDNWKAQRAEAKKQGVRLMPSPARNDPSGSVSVPLDALSTTIGGHEVGFKGQSISLPGLSVRKHPFVDPKGHYYKPLSPQQKAAAVYQHANSIDINSAISCIAADQVEDRLIGTFGRATQKASRKARLSVGIMTGPTF